MLENSFSWIHQFCQFFQFPEIQEKLSSSIFYENLGIELWYRQLVYPILKTLAWEICNIKWEFVKKSIIKSPWQCQVTFSFVNFVNFLKNPWKAFFQHFHKCLWIKLSSIPYSKGLSMRNLQYEISIYQKINDKPQWQRQVTLIFADSHITRVS